MRVTEDHLWETWISGKRRHRVRSTGEIMRLMSETKQRVLVPCGVAEFVERDVSIDPYTLGAILGDGGLTKHLTFTTADPEIIGYLDVEGCRVLHKGGYQYSIVSGARNEKGHPINLFAEKFKSLGLLPVSCDKRFIPDEYKFNSVGVRLSLLRGLLDTDGHITKKGRVSYCSKSYDLADGVCFLVRSLGGKASLRVKEIGGVDYYIVNITINENVFRLSRKSERYKPFNGGVSSISKRIVSIDFDGEEEAKCITIDSESSLYFTDGVTLTHNSWMGCEWLFVNCYRYPGSKWFIGRTELKRLMQSTFVTWGKVMKHHNIPADDWTLNSKYNYIEFKNGSRIDLLDVAKVPRDPMFERFGSTEYTGGWLEEAGEIPFTAYDVLKSRTGRHMNKEFGLKPPKIYITCNPSKGWLYRDVYLPHSKGELGDDWVFIQSLYSDNPHTAEDYGETLSKMRDKATRERLMYGNWEFDDDPAALIEYEAILDIFRNRLNAGMDALAGHEKFVCVDVARYGRDKTVIGIFDNKMLVSVEEMGKSGVDKVAERVREILFAEDIPYKNVIVDEDGVGGGVVDILRGVNGFVNGSKPIEEKRLRKGEDKSQYQNLKTQCYYKLAEAINEHKIGARVEDEYLRNAIIEELEWVKSRDMDKEGKLKLVEKSVVKENIGRSPDYSDMMMMRMWFDLKGNEGGRGGGIVQRIIKPKRYGRRV